MSTIDSLITEFEREAQTTRKHLERLPQSLAAAVRKMKAESGEDMTILGSGSIVAQLTQERLIDEYKLALNPIVLGKGRTMFEGISDKLNLN